MREVYTIDAWEEKDFNPSLPDFTKRTKSQEWAERIAAKWADSGKFEYVEVTFFRESDQQSGAINRYSGADFEPKNWVEAES